MGKVQFNTIYLNHDWSYVPSYKEEYIQSFPKSEKISLPHTNIELPFNNFSELDYQFISSYQNEFTFEKTPRKRYVLHFEGVMEYAEVYLNGKLIVTHKGGYTPFSMEITRKLKNGLNTLFVMVDSTERKDIPPHGFVVDYLTYGGIYREVYIEEKEMNYIDNAFVHVDNDELNIRLFLETFTQKDTVFKFNIYKNNQLVYFFEREYDLKKKDILVLEKVYLDLWSLYEPNLYELEIIMEEKLSFKTKFANRSIKMTTEGFFLNDEHIKLIGLNRHQSYPYVGYAMPSTAQKLDADILKYDLGVNTVRSSHYPPSKYFLHIGNKEWQEVAIENVKEMIYRDYNHPSVFIWGVRINESPDNDEFYKETNRIAKLYDTTRPTGGVRNFAGSHLFEDVFTYNDFIHRGDNDGLSKAKKIAKKNVPYLVTEYNGHMYPTKKFDDEFHRENQVKRHLQVQEDSFKYNNVSGAIGWCMFDYNTHKDFGSGDRICYHGVMDMFRIPKMAAGVYKSQDDNEVFLDVASNLNIGDREAGEIKEVYLLTNVDSVKFYINEDFIGEFYPSDRYSNLPHSPIIVDDFIGNLIHENEKFSEKDASRIKNILLYIMKHGMNLPIRYKLQMGIILLKYKMTIDQAAKLYELYVGKWGLESLEYRFEGIKDKVVVINKKLGPSNKSDLHLFCDNNEIEETSTYETTRVIVKHLDHRGNSLLYSNEVLNIKVEGPVKIIGPTNIALVGGSIGFYVKSIGKKGTAKIVISSNYYEDKIVEIKVI